MNVAKHLKSDECCIFLFHGVTRATDYQVRNYTAKHLSEQRFREVIADLVHAGTPVSMEDVAGSLADGCFRSPNSFAITFDDGFENNLSVAAPILREFGVPATFYISTRLVDENRMTWIDSVEDCLEHVGHGAVNLPWADKARGFSSPAEKIAMLEDIRAHVKSDRSIDETAFARSFCTALGRAIVEQSDDPIDKKLDWVQVEQLARCSLFTVGGHSHDHCNLAFLDPAALDDQIDRSLELLNAHLPYRVTHYSYPEGMENAFSPAVEAALRERGIVCCPTAIPGSNAANTSPFELRRITVR